MYSFISTIWFSVMVKGGEPQLNPYKVDIILYILLDSLL